MSRPLLTLCTALLLLITAGALRFAHLGAWSFSGDETATLTEERVLFNEKAAPPESQLYRLPRIAPVGYVIAHLSDKLFGSSEFGSRVGVAILGSLSVALLFLFLQGELGLPVALASALLLALMPSHLYQSQEARFYMVAAFFSFGCLLFGARVLDRRPTLSAIGASMCLILAVLTHTLLLILLPLLLAAIGARSYAQKTWPRRGVWLSLSLAALTLALVLVLYVRPLLAHWNHGESWGYSPARALLGAADMLGWPVALLALVGFGMMIRQRNGAALYWATCSLAFAGACIVLPCVVTYHNDYVFPLIVGPVIAAGYAVGSIYKVLRPIGNVVAVLWFIAACSINLPALASYYADGSRWDERAAAAFLQAQREPNDRIVGSAVGILKYYDPNTTNSYVGLEVDAPAQLKFLARTPGKLWIVLESNRAGVEPDLKRWLLDCTVHRFSKDAHRYDVADFRTDIFLATSPLPPRCLTASGP